MTVDTSAEALNALHDELGSVESTEAAVRICAKARAVLRVLAAERAPPPVPTPQQIHDYLRGCDEIKRQVIENEASRLATDRTPSADVVERVARAACAHKGINPDAIHQVIGGPYAIEDDKGTRYVYGWQKQTNLATAALSAIRPGDELPAGVVVPKAETPDWWYCDMDPDECGDSAYDAMFQHRPRLAPVELSTSYIGPKYWGVMCPPMPDADDDGDTGHTFDTREEAEAFIAERRAILSAAKGGEQ